MPWKRQLLKKSKTNVRNLLEMEPFKRGYSKSLVEGKYPLTRPYICWALRPLEDLTPLIVLGEAV